MTVRVIMPNLTLNAHIACSDLAAINAIQNVTWRLNLRLIAGDLNELANLRLQSHLRERPRSPIILPVEFESVHLAG
jgi:hypothetical protein